MFRINYSKVVDSANNIRYIEASCESTDVKPTEGVGQGSNVTESDTGDVYFYTESSETWTKMFTLKAAEAADEAE